MRASSVASSSVPVARSKITPEIVGPLEQISRPSNQFVLCLRHVPAPSDTYRADGVVATQAAAASAATREAMATASPIVA